ncbi:alpha/beta fold hydrolase [Pseudooceanicola sp.]|uniref:alpha/beta fold hydrolase n=1 Tax=Pseudooceanicola sp. TaxID=1914328 RepID=UPI00261ACBE1|nr:alpha/beta fold hydrolase [Pseudooceanicola sp.]MDF1854333.1 alpha/beta fold hydrolase [Pseudooceanicola sp.]
MNSLMISVIATVTMPAVIALGLIASQRPGEVDPGRTGAGLDFSGVVAGEAVPLPVTQVKKRDGTELAVRHLPGPPGAPLLILVHGSGWHGGQFDGLARVLAERAEVLVPDLRGHGAAPVRRGDVDYIGQLEDDLADLIAAYRQEGQKVVLGGHSSGGGLVVRFAGGTQGGMLDAAVLMAPFLQYDAPVTRPNSGGWAHVLTRRIIGLSMLNAVRIRALNHLTIIEFNMPEAARNGPQGHLATLAYSYRMNTSYGPRRDYKADIAALPDFVLIAGAEDEAFVADGYEPLMSEVTDKGHYLLVPGTGHLDIVDHPATAQAIAEVLDGLD